MTRPKTILITGGAGSLGSRTALAIEAAFPGKYHLILTARRITDPVTTEITTELTSAGVSFSWESLDLSSIQNVKDFVARVKDQLTTGDLKDSKLSGIINSAALSLYSRGKLTFDGFDPVYEINTLSLFLLTVGLLPLMESGGLVVNIASSTHKLGRVTYFWNEKAEKDWAEQSEGHKPGLVESLTRYGSSKLLATMLGFRLQEELNTKSPSRNLSIVSLDPGGMGGKSRLGDPHWFLKATVPILSILGPIVRVIDPSAFNPATVPAKCIAELFRQEGKNPGELAGKYFVLEKMSQSSPLSQDADQQKLVWDRVLSDLKLAGSGLGF